MLPPIMKRSDDSFEALLRVRAQEVERAVVAVANAERAVLDVDARLGAARELVAQEQAERASALADDVAKGGTFRAEDLKAHSAWLVAIDSRIEKATAEVSAREASRRAAEAVVAEKKRALADARGAERAIETHLETSARATARIAERSEEDDAMEAHAARRS
jgi:flagellar biosynthesis chaperone FliJ